MKAIVLVNADHSRFLAFVVAKDFDTQAWAERRRDSFRLLRIVAIEEHGR